MSVFRPVCVSRGRSDLKMDTNSYRLLQKTHINSRATVSNFIIDSNYLRTVVNLGFDLRGGA